MPRPVGNENSRLAVRIRSADKAVIARAAALQQTDMTAFVVRAALREAKSVIEKHQRIRLSERDSRLVIELLENPPAPNAKLRKAARAMPEKR